MIFENLKIATATTFSLLTSTTPYHYGTMFDIHIARICSFRGERKKNFFHFFQFLLWKTKLRMIFRQRSRVGSKGTCKYNLKTFRASSSQFLWRQNNKLIPYFLMKRMKKIFSLSVIASSCNFCSFIFIICYFLATIFYFSTCILHLFY